ncbi:MAG TPA: ABC transporter permease [Alphaproteobacteria bacterium]|nr:ABC transporter permease [Alphaproteobacteria bacterium]
MASADIAKLVVRNSGRFAFTLALTLTGLIFVTFVIGRLLPIDPVVAIVGDRASHEVYVRVRHEIGLDLPIYVQFWRYLTGILSGNFGNSVMSSRPVVEDLTNFFPATFELATISTLIGLIAGIPAGVIAAARRGALFDHAVRVVALVGYSVPVFWLGLVALLIFYVDLGVVAGPGRIDIAYQYSIEHVTGIMLIDTLLARNWDAFENAVSHTILPCAILGYYSMAYITRMTRGFMLEQLQQEYITTALVKGLSERRVIWVHAFRNIMVPLITVIALAYANLLEGAVLTETIFAWPGVGLYITQSLFSADLNGVLGGTILVGACFVLINVAADQLYRFFDPRARAR